MARSFPLIIRVMIMVQAQASADTMGKKRQDETRLSPAAGESARRSIPPRLASQRRTPTLSTEKKIDSAVRTRPKQIRWRMLQRWEETASRRWKKKRRRQQRHAPPSTGSAALRLQGVQRRTGSIAGNHDHPETQKSNPGNSRSTAMSQKIFRGGSETREIRLTRGSFAMPRNGGRLGRARYVRLTSSQQRQWNAVQPGG